MVIILIIIIVWDFLFGGFVGKKLTTEEFIVRAKAVHGDRYDYSFVEYNTIYDYIKIICHVHGEFMRTARSHLNGYGCQICSDSIMRKTTNKFIAEATAIHGEFDYSEVVYINAHTKVKIKCEKHGFFEQDPHSHLKGGKCPKCSGRYSGKYDKNNIPVYETYHERLESIGVECKRDDKDKNVLSVRCYKCGKWHVPSKVSVRAKLSTISRNISEGRNFYCSDGCKSSCVIYNFKLRSIDPRSILAIEKTITEKARSCQTATLKQLQCDDVGHNYCERCGDIIDVDLHHTHEVSKFGIDAISSAGHMLLCAGCHMDIHRGCK